MIRAALLRERPVLSWRTDDIAITAGTSWVTVAMNGMPASHLRGRGPLGQLHAGLGVLLEVEGARTVTLAPGLTATTTVSPQAPPNVFCLSMAGPVARNLVGHGVHETLRDLRAWLGFLHHGSGLPADFFHDVRMEGGCLRFTHHREMPPWAVRIGDRRALGKAFLEGKDTYVSSGELTICALSHKYFLTYAGREWFISRTAGACLGAMLLS